MGKIYITCPWPHYHMPSARRIIYYQDYSNGLYYFFILFTIYLSKILSLCFSLLKNLYYLIKSCTSAQYTKDPSFTIDHKFIVFITSSIHHLYLSTLTTHSAICHPKHTLQSIDMDYQIYFHACLLVLVVISHLK